MPSRKKLFIIRHAKSSWKDLELSDFDRPLNGRGKKNAPMMGERLRDKNVVADIIISSSALRAKKTAKIIAKKVRYSKEIIYDENIYASTGMLIHKIVKKIDDKNDSAFFIGHNSDLNMFAQEYVNFDENIVTCGIVEIEFDCKHWKDISKSNAKFISYDYPKKEQK